MRDKIIWNEKAKDLAKEKRMERKTDLKNPKYSFN